MKKINLNQPSYNPTDTKIATITFDTPRFSVIRESDKKIMFRDNTKPPSGDVSSDTVMIADFSYLSEIGLYFIKATSKDGTITEESDPFVITNE